MQSTLGLLSSFAEWEYTNVCTVLFSFDIVLLKVCFGWSCYGGRALPCGIAAFKLLRDVIAEFQREPSLAARKQSKTYN